MRTADLSKTTIAALHLVVHSHRFESLHHRIQSNRLALRTQPAADIPRVRDAYCWIKRSNRRSFWRTLKKTRPPTTEAGLVFLLGRLDLLLLLNDRLAGFLHRSADGFHDGGKIGLGTIG